MNNIVEPRVRWTWVPRKPGETDADYADRKQRMTEALLPLDAEVVRVPPAVRVIL